MKRNSNSIGRVASYFQRGVTLLEVVLAIAVFTFGMLALAHLQSNIGRSSTDSNTRTVAVNIAEEIIERARNWKRLGADPNNPSTFPDVIYAFDDLSGTMTATVQRGGVDYNVTAEITDYYHDLDADPGVSFSPNDELGTGRPKFKVMEITVEWVSAEFLRGEGTDNENVGNLGSGGITVTDIIPSTSSLGSGKIVAADDGVPQGPPTAYNPGLAPDVIRLNIDGTRYKESSAPVPKVIRSGELSETWFDVVTYNLVNNEASFVRREEFVALSCQCTLRSPSGQGNDGLYPAIWTGVEYSIGADTIDDALVGKWHGESASNQQSIYCDVCCRDHHDGDSTSADQRYRANGGVPAGDHEHYDINLVLADSDGDDYVESCRLIRKDGFFRVAQDAQLDGFNAFPDFYLDGLGSTTYANYVVDAVEDYYNSSRTELLAPEDASAPWYNSYDFPANNSDGSDATDLPTGLGLTSQQLRARGIYLDHLGAEVATLINCMHPSGLNMSGPECGAPDATHWLEVYPFFDIQMTFLGFWREDSGADPVSVTDETVETDNSHSKGLAVLESDELASVIATSQVNTGNIGLSVTDKIYPSQDNEIAEADVHIDANGINGPPSPPTGTFYVGEINSSVGGVQAADAAIAGGSLGIICTRAQNEFTCIVEDGAPTPHLLRVSGYYKNANTDLWACTNNTTALTAPVYVQGPNKSTTWTLVNAAGTDVSGINITIQGSVCATP